MTRLYAIPALAIMSTLCMPHTSAFAQTPEPDSEPRTPVTLRVSPEDARVTLDGKLIDASHMLSLTDGEHVLRIEATGYIPREETLLIANQAGREILLSVNLSAEPPTPEISMRSDGIIEQMDYGRPITGWIMTGAGAALITTSIVLAVRSSTPTSCETPDQTSTCKDLSQDLAGWATFTGVLGGASLIGGLTLLSWRSLAGEPQTLGVNSASLSTSGTGLLLRIKY